jgi:multiple sugar transport system substrate-binding protein
MEAELVAAVQAGGEVPDIFHGADNQLFNFVRNGAVQDLTDWAMAQDWYADMDPQALEACKGQDGRLYCIPVSEVPFVTFVWADRFPDGFPTTPDGFMAAAERLDAEGLDVMTYFGSTDFDGDGAERAVWTIVSGFGGTYDDGQGNMLLNIPENVAAIDFLRTLAVNGYVPEVAFAGGFQEEEAFKDASAASIPTGMFGYRYIRPLTAPNGNTYTTETEQDMLDAIDAGDVVVRPFVAPEGNDPGCSLQVEGFFIPTGAQNIEAAYDYITWIMTDIEQNADWVARASAGIPALKTALGHENFQSEFYRQAIDTAEASACRPPHGTLERWDEAKPMIMNAVYKLVKEDPTADIAAELQEVQDEYNGGVQPVQPPEPTEEEAAPSGEVQDFVTWYQFDQDNDDPANDEAIGNAYIRETLPQFNEAFAGKWNWINVPKAWDKMPPELTAAVLAGGDVPDLMQASESNTANFVRNGILQDFTDWAQAQPWYSDMDPNALDACTFDGKLYCFPIAETPQVVFAWADYFPDGYPDTPAEFEAKAEELKAQGVNIWTYFGSTDFDGNGTGRATWTVISSFGGTYDDGQGNMLLNSPENVAAVEFMRKAAVEGWTTEVSFAGGFQEEEAFKDASAASIPTGIFGYRYIRPLTAPNGNTYTTETEQDMLDAIEAGDVMLTPFLAAEGEEPGCGLAASVLVMPVGAKNPEAAYDYINWLMSEPEQNADWVIRGAAGLPVLQTTYDQPEFQTKFYQEARETVEASACRPWQGSLERTAEAQPLIMNAVYKLVKEDPTADIATVLQEAQDEYNAQN